MVAHYKLRSEHSLLHVLLDYLSQYEPFCQVRREETQWLDGVVGAVGIGHFVMLLIMASNFGAAKSIAPCEATEPGKYVTYKYIFLF